MRFSALNVAWMIHSEEFQRSSPILAQFVSIVHLFQPNVIVLPIVTHLRSDFVLVKRQKVEVKLSPLEKTSEN